MNIKPFAELIENCSYCIKYLVSSADALENGDIAACQSQTKKAQELLSVMITDVFNEVKELIQEHNGIFDCDEATPSTLIYQLANINIYAADLLTIEKDGSAVYNITETSLAKAINTVTRLYKALYDND